MDDDERRLLLDSLSQVVSGAATGDLRAAVTGFGWHDMLAESPQMAVYGISTLQGEHLTETTMLDDIVLAAAGIEGPARVVYPDLPHSDPTSRIEGTASPIRGVLAAGDAERLVVPAWHGSEVVIVTAPGAVDSKAPADGLDPDSGWHRVETHLDLSTAEVLEGEPARTCWQALLAAGQRALAYELNALGRRMLTLAVEHVSTREQFGRRIGGFQAVKHALADVRLWQECAELAAEAAWEDESPESAQLAKIMAGRFVRTAAANCQQVLGGMGFTWEHDFHRYLRRALLLEPLLGSAAHLRTALGARVRAQGAPRLALL
ncbi:acyl-CoA dehydrogenase [Actinomadura sp. NBRC 104425]|uniref:acyl-CoA dehydrogenase family protein n=1 Tax=Actinomadura sp. NBRC 104425 TaxID=3032204 RepID=UPI0024A1AD68|nr:acyl-CoA dehydrogenase family protein [Actinomadura sp. NBRC 104425]GLZ15971.1 acyl-CoA dehydrogenase [Actinomadura sp. NBRC 104425]